MNEIRQHVPNFIQIEAEPHRAAFETLDELLLIPFVMRWSEDPSHYRFVQDRGIGNWYLIAEQDNGTRWWVVGYLKEQVPGLPEWREPKR